MSGQNIQQLETIVEEPLVPSNDNQQEETQEEKQEWGFEYDRYFLSFLRDHKVGILVCSYKSSKLFSIGTTYNKNANDNVLSFWITEIPRVMSSAYDKNTNKLVVGSQMCVSHFYNSGSSESDNPIFDDFDVTFTERRINIVNDIDIHDIALDQDGTPYFCSPLFSSICTVSDTHSIKVYWTPPWISKVASEDRCHLNGLCCGPSGKPQYVTSVSRTDILNGWRKYKRDGGVVYDIINDKLICKNLSMPHSPVYHNGKLWVLNSGTGYFGYVDTDTTKIDEDDEFQAEYHPFVECVFIPGFIRGMSFINNSYVIVGSSKDRHEQTFTGLQLNETLKKKRIDAMCGLFIINLNRMDIEHHFVFGENTKNDVNEIYDVACIPDCNRPTMVSKGQVRPTDYTIEE
jgi:uncharacterized protein (TIGR03032 family)